jgi:RHS repeat-associated protein
VFDQQNPARSGAKKRKRGLYSGRTLPTLTFLALLGLLLVFGLSTASGDEPADEGTGASAPKVISEIAEKRTALSRTFGLSDGQLETRLFQEPVNYRNEDGDWKPIEQELQETASGAVVNGDNAFDVLLPDDLGEAPVKVELADQVWVTQMPLSIGDLEPGEVDHGVASYEAASGAAELQFSGLANGLKETIVLANPSAPSTYRFRLKTSPGVEPTLTAGGSIRFSNEEGVVVAVTPAPTMNDANGVAARTGAVRYRLESDADAQTWSLAVEVDPQWLSDELRAWPVEIDPTVVISWPSNCAIFTDTSTSCGGTPLLAKAKYLTSGSNAYARTLLRFDLSEIPLGASITSATVALYSPKTATNVTQVDLFDLSTNWTQEGLSWTNASAPANKWATAGGDYGALMKTPASVTTASRGSQSGWWSFSSSDLVDVVEAWRDADPPGNYGVLLKLADEVPRVCCIERRVEWESSAATNKPYLSLQYTLPATLDSKVTSPTDGTNTAKRLTLKAAWDHPNVEGVTFQYKKGHSWWDIPTGQVIDGDNLTPSWPLKVIPSDRSTQPLYWNVSSLAGSDGTAKIKIRAILSGAPGASGYTVPVEAELDQNGGGAGDAQAPIGPGSVNLLTGNFSLSRTDVAIPGFQSFMQFSRSTNSRETGGSAVGVLGPGWQVGAPVEEAGGSAWQSLRIEKEVEVIDHGEGETETIVYEWASLSPISGQPVNFDIGEKGEFVTPAEMAGTIMSRLNGSEIVLTDPEGNRTVFTNYGSGTYYLPITVTQTGGPGNKTQLVYDLVAGNRRLKRVIAPAAGVTCSAEGAMSTDGCHVLAFAYKTGEELGFSSSRLTKITYYAPGNGGPWDVASYSYDTAGRLASVWDPRISPALKESYTYTSGGQVQTLTPPGQESWTMTYGTIAGETTGGRLLAVKRPSLVAGSPTAQISVAYGVPLSKGSGGPHDMTPSDVATWGQEDLPADATAIFPPDEVPASPPSSYARASVYYMDAEGQVVNVASPAGAGTTQPSITTTETDAFGNVVRELSAQNRLRAMAEGAGSVAKSRELDTQYGYSADGIMLQQERGPVHGIRIESGPKAGTVVQGRSYRAIFHDKGAPTPKAGEPMPFVPTNETTGALVGDEFLDQRSVEYKYDWTLRKQIETIVDPEGKNIRSITAYDSASGLPVEYRQPKDAGTPGAGTTRITYYKPGTAEQGECFKTRYAGLPCKVAPAVQPSTGPQLPVTRYVAYSALGQPTQTVQETSGSTPGTRTTFLTFDAAGRRTSAQNVGGGTEIPRVETLYSANNGLPTTRRFVCPAGEPSCDQQSTTTAFDALGRIIEYQDADGGKATMTYDLNGRVKTFNDGKGSQAIAYDGPTGLPVEMTDSMAGTFTASYDADGNLVKQGFPNGLTAETALDSAGQPTDLTYTKASSCGTSCTWLDLEVTRSARGQILSEAGTLGTKQYEYDAASRLISAKETPQGGGCTTRIYGFDQDSNRTSMTTRTPGIGGVCAGSGGTTQSYSYDGADRLTASGLTYDAFGRITSLPSAYAGGSSLQTGYFSNDMIATQTQGGVTNTFALDASLRQRQRSQAGGIQGVEIFHYANGSDVLAWTQLGETWTRNVTGITGDLVAVAQSGAMPRLQLTNLHGDVVATASVDPAVTQYTLSARTDEFGKPISGTPGRFGWMGGTQRRTELASGVIQMGARSYVPSAGRFLTADPIGRGSANAYDYGNADPVNQSDPSGLEPHANACDRGAVGCQVWLHLRMWSPRGGRMGVRMIIRTNRAGGIRRISFDINYWVDVKDDVYREGFVEMAPPHYLNSYPGVPSSCRTSDPCAANHDGRGTFACRPGNEYQIGIIFKYRYNFGKGVQDAQVLEVKAQEFCRY